MANIRLIQVKWSSCIFSSIFYFTHPRHQQHRRDGRLPGQVPRQSPAQRLLHTILNMHPPPSSGGAVSRSPWGLPLTPVVIATNSIPNTKNSPLIYKSKNYYLDMYCTYIYILLITCILYTLSQENEYKLFKGTNM